MKTYLCSQNISNWKGTNQNNLKQSLFIREINICIKVNKYCTNTEFYILFTIIKYLILSIP